MIDRSYQVIDRSSQVIDMSYQILLQLFTGWKKKLKYKEVIIKPFSNTYRMSEWNAKSSFSLKELDSLMLSTG